MPGAKAGPSATGADGRFSYHGLAPVRTKLGYPIDQDVVYEERGGVIVAFGVDQLSERFRPALQQKIAWVQVIGKRQHAKVGIGADKELEHFVRPLAPRFVAIENGDDS